MSKDESDMFHEPADEAFASLGLELRRPVLDGDEKSTRAWQEIKACHRAIGQSVQRAIGEVVLKVREMRAAGHTRFAIRQNASTRRWVSRCPGECYTKEDLDGICDAINDSLRTSGVSEYVYASVARKLLTGEFSNSKLRTLLRGEIAYPVIRSPAIMMRARNWRLGLTERVANGKIYLDIDIEISALRPGLGQDGAGDVTRSMVAILQRYRPILKALQAMETATTGTAAMVPPKGGVRVLFPCVLCAGLDSPRSGKFCFRIQPRVFSVVWKYCCGGGPPECGQHAECGCFGSTGPDAKVQIYHYPGKTVVSLKNQMYQRRRMRLTKILLRNHMPAGESVIIIRHWLAYPMRNNVLQKLSCGELRVGFKG